MKVDPEETVVAAFGGNGDKQTGVGEKSGEVQNGMKRGDGGTSGTHGLLKDW